jgi:hypothetical protein
VTALITALCSADIDYLPLNSDIIELYGAITITDLLPSNVSSLIIKQNIKQNGDSVGYTKVAHKWNNLPIALRQLTIEQNEMHKHNRSYRAYCMNIPYYINMLECWYARRSASADAEYIIHIKSRYPVNNLIINTVRICGLYYINVKMCVFRSCHQWCNYCISPYQYLSLQLQKLMTIANNSDELEYLPPKIEKKCISTNWEWIKPGSTAYPMMHRDNLPISLLRAIIYVSERNDPHTSQPLPRNIATKCCYRGWIPCDTTAEDAHIKNWMI